LSWLDKIDLYIQPSVTEGLPRALIEAMSRACPSIGSMVGGIPELLDSKYLFHKKNVEELLNMLSEINTNNRLLMAAENFKKAQDFNHETLETQRKQAFEFYRNCVIQGIKKK
jgi:glycosyltransferase involved in cell wall biosynthesis